MNYYVISFDSIVEDYISIDDSQFSVIENACISSEFQHIPIGDMSVYTSDNGGTVFPDFYYNGAVPLLSEDLYKNIREYISGAVPLKKVKVISEVLNRSRNYILCLPEAIHCVDTEHSEYTEFPVNDIITVMDIEKLVINSRRTGNYSIFKIADTFDTNIYVTEDLKNYIMKFNPVGVSFWQYDMEYSDGWNIFS